MVVMVVEQDVGMVVVLEFGTVLLVGLVGVVVLSQLSKTTALQYVVARLVCHGRLRTLPGSNSDLSYSSSSHSPSIKISFPSHRFDPLPSYLTGYL